MPKKDFIETSAIEEQPTEVTGHPLVTILYSTARDLYRIPAINKPMWLSVKAYELPASQLGADTIYLGASLSPDGKHWRKSYSTAWRSIIAGDQATLPANDPMVIDFQ